MRKTGRMHRLLRFTAIHATVLVAFVFHPPSTEAQLMQRLLPGGKLAPGRYILSARLITPTEHKLYDTYEFTHGEP